MITGHGIIFGRNQGKTPHDPLTLATSGDTLLGLSTQELSLDTQAANLGFFGPTTGVAAAPTFRALVDADFPATLNPTFAGLGATPIVTSYAGPHAIGTSVLANTQFLFAGSFISSNVAFGVSVNSILTPGGAWSAHTFYVQGTFNMVANQVHSEFSSLRLNAPTINAASGASLTKAATLVIFDAPTAGVKNYAVDVVAGASRFGALTASLPIITDSDKVLASLAYTGATSFRKNLGLETDDSPTFDQGNFTTLHTTTILTDHIGEHGSAHTVVFDNSVTLGALSGVLKATAGLVAGSAVHSDLGSIGANDHHNAITLDTNADTLLSLSTQALGLDTQTANYGLFGPTSGAVAVPTFRAMVAADLGTALTPTFAGIVIADAGTIGLGSGKGRIQFNNGTVDSLNYMDCNVSFGAAGATVRLEVAAVNSAPMTGGTAAGTFALLSAPDRIYGLYAGVSNSGSTWIQSARNDSEVYYNILLQPSGGKVGVGDIAPGELLDVAGNINLTGVLKIDDVQVVKEQQAHIADAKADYIEADLDTAAEVYVAVNATNAKINAILLMLETHGLVHND